MFQLTWGEKEKRVGAGGGGRMDESYRKILHATVRCAVVTRSRSATMRSFVPKIGTKRHTYPHRHTHIKPPTMHTHTDRDPLWVSGADDCLSGGEMNKKIISGKKKKKKVGNAASMCCCTADPVQGSVFTDLCRLFFLQFRVGNQKLSIPNFM